VSSPGISSLGLTSQEAEVRLRKDGPNLIEKSGERSLASLIWDVISNMDSSMAAIVGAAIIGTITILIGAGRASAIRS